MWMVKTSSAHLSMLMNWIPPASFLRSARDLRTSSPTSRPGEKFLRSEAVTKTRARIRQSRFLRSFLRLPDAVSSSHPHLPSAVRQWGSSICQWGGGGGETLLRLPGKGYSSHNWMKWWRLNKKHEIFERVLPSQPRFASSSGKAQT